MSWINTCVVQVPWVGTVVVAQKVAAQIAGCACAVAAVDCLGTPVGLCDGTATL